MIDEHKDLYFDEIRTPNMFFCTFERTRASTCLLKLEEPEVKIGAHSVSYRRASAPSDILWENHSLPNNKRLCRLTCLVLWMFPLLFFVMKLFALFLQGK